MIYQIAKSVGAATPVLYGKVDAILLTGGMARSSYIIPRLRQRIDFIAPVHVYPGEDEMEALALNAIGALKGEPYPYRFMNKTGTGRTGCSVFPAFLYIHMSATHQRHKYRA